MATLASLLVVMGMDTTGMSAGAAKAKGSLASVGASAKSSLGTLVPFAAAAAGAAVLKFGADSIGAFSEAQQVMAQTEAVLKSTGGQAGLTAQDIVGLSSRLRDLSGVDDEAIQASSNLLLTFRAVRDEVGAGNDIFTQSQGAILDMATALNHGAIPATEDLKSATLQLGKALNDPLTGLTALRRAGVSFTAGQVEVIKSLVESGDLMSAQKLILQELQQEFGGAAKAAGDTFGGQMAKLSSQFGDLQEQIGEILVPVVEDLVSSLSDLLTMIESVGSGFDTFNEQTDGLGSKVVNLGQAVMGLLNPFDKLMHPSHIIPWVAWKNAVDTARGATDAESDALDGLGAALGGVADKAKVGDGVISGLTDEMLELEQQTRDARLAQLALADSFVGLASSAQDVSEAQRELNRLERQGKEDTAVYRSAVLDAITAQSGLESSVVTYAQELIESGETQRAVTGKVRDLAREFGIQGDVVRDLVGDIRDLIREGEQYDGSVWSATFEAHHVATGTLGGITKAAHGFLGMVDKPTLFLAGEAGRELVNISPGGDVGIGAQPAITIINNVEGSVTTERQLIDVVRDGLIEAGRSGKGHH